MKSNMTRITFRRTDSKSKSIIATGTISERMGYAPNICDFSLSDEHFDWFERLLKEKCVVGLSISDKGLEVFFSSWGKFSIEPSVFLGEKGEICRVGVASYDVLFAFETYQKFPDSTLKIRSDGKVTCHVTLPGEVTYTRLYPQGDVSDR